MTGLPQGWAEAKIAELLDVARGGSPRPIQAYLTDDPDGLNWIKISDATSGGARIQSTKQKIKPSGLLKTRAVKPGDFLLSNSMSFGKPYICDIDGCIHDGWLVLGGVDRAFDPDFLYHCLRSDGVQRQFSDKAAGSTVQNLNSDLVRDVVIPLPPVPEQRRIVRKLDALSARSTTARTHLAAIEKLVKRMRGAVLSQALNGRLVASQLDCGEPVELGRFITGIEQGWSPKCDNEQELDPTKWAVLTTTAIQAITFDSTENKQLPENLSPRPHLEVEAGDVLMTRAGPRVRCAVCCYVAETAPRRIFSDKIYRIRLDKSVEPEFFAMMMNAPAMVRALDAIKSGGSESGLNLTQDRLKSLAINIWDRPTQVEVVADIKRQFAKIDRLAAEAVKALKLLGHLDGRILARAFAGDLVPQDPTDKPAETLLARIRETRAAAPKSRRRRK